MAAPSRIATHRWILLLACAYLVLFLLLPSSNQGIDAWAYAAAVKYKGELFHPHHLLYNATQFAILKVIRLTGLHPDTLRLMTMVNALVAAGILLVLAKILEQGRRDSLLPLAGMIFAGSAFGIMRYAAENETYLFPLLLALAGSLWYIRYLNTLHMRAAWLSGFFTSLAVLFHQIAVFWWLGLLFAWMVYGKNRKAWLAYLLSGFLVPAAYLAVWLLAGHASAGIPLYQFALHAYFSGDASVDLTKTDLLLGLAGLVRSFIQVHGNILLFVRNNIWFVLPAVGLTVSLTAAIIPRHPGFFKGPVGGGRVAVPHALIALLTWVFAVIAGGNAEFMVMIPVLVLLVLTFGFRVNPSLVLILGLGMLVWNTGYGILPGHLYRYEPVGELARLAEDQPGNLFILEEDQHVQALYYYHTGKETAANIARSPGEMERRGIPADSLHLRIQSVIRNGGRVFTDCLVRPRVLNRATLLSGNDSLFFARYWLEEAEQLKNFYGITVLHRVLPKE